MARGMKIADLAFLGRVGNAGVTPTSYAGLEGWLKADTFPGASDGDAIGAIGQHWIDQTGNGHDGFNHTGLNKPSYQTNEVGSMPIVRFAPGDQAFLSLVTPYNLTGDLTIIFTMRKASTIDTIMLAHDVLNHQVRRSRATVNNASFYSGSVETISSGFASAVTALQVVTYRRSGLTVSLRENKTARGTGAEPLLNAAQFDRLGNSFFLGTGEEEIAELIIYNQHRSDAEVDLLYDQYLKPRWTTLP